MTFQKQPIEPYPARCFATATATIAVATANGAHANAYTYIFASSLRSGMRSIARRIESGPTRGREGAEAREREREKRYTSENGTRETRRRYEENG